MVLRRFRVVVALLAMIASFFGGSAHAEDRRETEASLKESADAAVLEGNLPDAVATYTRAIELHGPLEPVLHFNRGRAYESMGRFVDAVADLEAFRKMAPTTQIARVPDLDAHLAMLRARVGTIEVTCSVDGASVSFGTTARGVTPLPPQHVNPGRERIRVAKPGYVTFERDVDAVAGGTTRVDVTLSLEPKPASRWWVWAVAGAAIVGAGVTVFALTREEDPKSGSLPSIPVNAFRF